MGFKQDSRFTIPEGRSQQELLRYAVERRKARALPVVSGGHAQTDHHVKAQLTCNSSDYDRTAGLPAEIAVCSRIERVAATSSRRHSH